MKRLYRFTPWVVIFMAFIATGLSFLDRQVMSVSIIKINEEFPISDTEYGYINTGFLISYAIMFTLGGILIDRWGSKKGLAYSVGIWSLATVCHGFANNAAQFTMYRFLLGLGEGGAFPGAIKAVVEWIPKKRQALANGIAIGGSAVGAVVAPPLCVHLIDKIGWRGVFIVIGGIGLLWVVIWLLLPKKELVEGSPAKVKTWKETWLSIAKLFKVREVWVFIAMRFLLDPIFYFYMFWIPKYLNSSRGMDLELIGELYWIPFLALGVSNMLGGFLSDKILQKSGNLDRARKSVMGLAAVLTVPAVVVNFVPDTNVVIGIMVLAFFAHGLWITNYITSISDIFGKSITSTVVGLSGTAGALSSVIINPMMGDIIAKFSYDPMWIYAGVMYGIVFLFFLKAIPKIRYINIE